MIKVKITWFQDEFFFLLKLPLLSFVFNHHGHFEVSNTIKEKTAQGGAWAIVCSFFFKAGEIVVEAARRSDFPGEGLWRQLGLTFRRNATPALRGVCGVQTEWRQGARARDFPPSWGALHPAASSAAARVCSALIKERDHLQASVWSKRGFFQAAPGSLF